VPKVRQDGPEVSVEGWRSDDGSCRDRSRGDHVLEMRMRTLDRVVPRAAVLGRHDNKSPCNVGAGHFNGVSDRWRLTAEARGSRPEQYSVRHNGVCHPSVRQPAAIHEMDTDALRFSVPVAASGGGAACAWDKRLVGTSAQGVMRRRGARCASKAARWLIQSPAHRSGNGYGSGGGTYS